MIYLMARERDLYEFRVLVIDDFANGPAPAFVAFSRFGTMYEGGRRHRFRLLTHDAYINKLPNGKTLFVWDGEG